MNRYRFVLAIAVALVIVVAAVGIHPGRSAAMGTLYITPNDVNVASGTVTYKIYTDSVGASTTSGINAWNLIIDDHDAVGASLTPISISIAGNLLAPFGTVTEIINCVNGGTSGAPPGPGNSGCDVNDGPGIVHTAAVLQGPATPTPISGLIATITYTAVSSSPTTLGFVSTPSGGDLLTDGSSSPVPHTTRGASFATTSPDFVITATDSPAFNPGGTGSSTVTLTGLNGFAGSVSLTHTEYPSTGLNVNCPASGTPSASGATVNCTFSGTTPGAYVVTLTGTSGSNVHLAPINVNVGDFSLGNPLPSPVKFNSGLTGTTKLIVRSVTGFAGSVSFSTSTTPTTGLTVDCGAPVTVSPTLSPTVTCAFSSSTPATYSVIITGTFSITGGGTITHTKSVSVVVMSVTPPPDFTISPTTAVSVQATGGTAAMQTITLAAVNGFTGTVSLATVTPLPAGLTCNAIPSVTLPGATTATLSCTAANAGDFPVTVKGTSGTLTHSTGTITFHAVAAATPDFTISPSAAVTVQATVGTAATQTITLAATNGFTGTVNLAVVTPLPTGLTCGAIPSVTLPAATTATLSCTPSAAGDFPVTVTGASGTLSHSTGVISFHAVVAGVLSLSANPNPVNTNVNVAGISQITVSAPTGTTGTVAFQVTPSTGLTCDPLAPVTLPAITTTMLSCKAATAADYTVALVASVGSLTSSALTVNYHVTQPVAQTLSLLANPNPVSTTVTVAGTSTIAVTANGGLTGAVTFTVTPQTGLVCLSIPSITLPHVSTATLSCTTAVAGTYTAQVKAAVGTVTSPTITVTFNVASVTPPGFTVAAQPTTVTCNVGDTSKTSMITVTAQGGFTGTVALAVQSSAAGVATGALSSLTVTGGAGSVTLNISCIAPGSSTLTVAGTSGTLTPSSATVTVTVNQPVAVSFSVTSTVNSLSCNAGSNAPMSTITVTGDTGFEGVVMLSVTVSPNNGGITATLSNLQVTGSGSSTLSVQCVTAGTYMVNVEGVSGTTVKHAPLITVTVLPVQVIGDFTVTAKPDNVTVEQGDKAKSTITVKSLNSFTDTVNLSAAVSCANVHADLSKLHLVIQKDSSNHTRLVISADASASLGICTVTVTGVSGSLSHTATVKVTVVAEEKNECVETGDDDDGHHGASDEKTMGKDRDDDECMEEGHGHECKGDNGNGLGDAKDARDRDMKTRDDCVAKCHHDNENVEAAEHENSRNDCMTSATHGTDHDDNNSGHSMKGSRDNDVRNDQGEALVSLTDSDRWIALDSKDSS